MPCGEGEGREREREAPPLLAQHYHLPAVFSTTAWCLAEPLGGQRGPQAQGMGKHSSEGTQSIPKTIQNVTERPGFKTLCSFRLMAQAHRVNLG